jgi:hypothetical protein
MRFKEYSHSELQTQNSTISPELSHTSQYVEVPRVLRAPPDSRIDRSSGIQVKHAGVTGQLAFFENYPETLAA